jgi:uncharacterized protein YodC (DUF2158 family)
MGMSEAIQKGDKVRLKSGGPNMMVDDIGEGGWGSNGDTRVWCEWFDDKNVPQRKDFNLASVEKVA